MLLFRLLRKPFLVWPALAIATVVFYSIPLFSRQASIHWDLADVFYPAQKFFADSLRAGKLPQWTPYLNSGIPFLTDPRTGAWYPLHWPFYFIGITPRVMVWELAVHAFLALAGAYLLARRLFGARGPALLGGVLYGFSGFFAAHSSALGQFEAAALLPGLIWAALVALESGARRWMAITGLIGGLIVLTGDGPGAVESLVTLVCLGVAARGRWTRTVATVGAAMVLGCLLGAIVILPELELQSQSHPGALTGVASTAKFQPKAMATLVAADYYGVISGVYSGPEDPRQYYFYGGLLLLPLAVAGFARREKALVLLALIAPTIMFYLARRPPGDAMFPAGLALAMAAVSGAVSVGERTERPYVWAALVALSIVDLWFWNLYKNPLAFARAPFSEIYGEAKARPAGLQERPFSRTWAPYVPVGSGPADGSLISHTEVTYGTGLAELDRYTAYLAAVDGNPKLLNGLGVTDLLLGRGKRLDNPASLGRVSVARHVVFVADRKAALGSLASLDPAETAVVEGAPRNLTQAVESTEIVEYRGDAYRIRYQASSESLLLIAVPYYPGWTAVVDGTEVSVVPADEALVGVFVPAGSHELMLRFQPRRFGAGVALSGVGVVCIAIGLILL